MYDAMNKGLAAFTGEAVGVLNSDDRFKDERPWRTSQEASRKPISSMAISISSRP